MAHCDSDCEAGDPVTSTALPGRVDEHGGMVGSAAEARREIVEQHCVLPFQVVRDLELTAVESGETVDAPTTRRGRKR